MLQPQMIKSSKQYVKATLHLNAFIHLPMVMAEPADY